MRPALLALLSAVLFGVSTPASKLLLAEIPAQQLAGLLYLGAALGVLPMALRGGRRAPRARLDRKSGWLLAGAVAAGGVAGPLALLFALRLAPSSDVSLLLNLELVATALLGVAFFRESIGGRGRIGLAVVIAASAALSSGGGWPGVGAGLLVALACLCWGLDNQMTALIDGMTPAGTTLVKGLVAGAFNLGVGFALAGWSAPPAATAAALAVGAVSYGLSLVLHIGASQQLGATRTQAIFASAPFVGAAASLALPGEHAGADLLAASLVLAGGVALALADRHEHAHRHDATEHVHEHRHDDGHHDHAHADLAPGTRHAHWHRHEAVAHAHPHVPDLHHRHEH